jgi:hypothetical protein
VRGFLGAFCAFAIERERLAWAYGRLVRGIDLRPLYTTGARRLVA